jgi:hypothetical protein
MQVRPAGKPQTDTVEDSLDPGIKRAVLALRAAGIETFESCEGGKGHTFPEATIRFNGDHPEAFKAVYAAMSSGFKVYNLRRVWRIENGEPVGPWWEITLFPRP